MKSVLGLTIPLENLLDALHRAPGYKVSPILIESLSLIYYQDYFLSLSIYTYHNDFCTNVPADAFWSVSQVTLLMADYSECMNQ
jgi:hypothetical protein